MSDTDPYLIPGTRVLRNRLGLTDSKSLDAAERQLVIQRSREGAPAGDFNLAHAKAIHRHLFQDVYDWAGQVRTVEISKGAQQFQPCQFLETGMNDVHRRVCNADYLRNLDPSGFAAKAGEIIGDMNFAHPFREGNGRTQLEYLRQLGERAGHPLDPGKLDRDDWIAASVQAHSGNYKPIAAAILQQVILARDLQQTPKDTSRNDPAPPAVTRREGRVSSALSPDGRLVQAAFNEKADRDMAHLDAVARGKVKSDFARALIDKENQEGPVVLSAEQRRLATAPEPPPGRSRPPEEPPAPTIEPPKPRR